MSFKHLGLATGMLLICNSAFASVPIVLGSWSGQLTATATGCSGNPSLDGHTSSETVNVSITNQTSVSASLDTIEGTATGSGTDFWSAETDPFVGYIDDTGSVAIETDPGTPQAEWYYGTYVNGMIVMDPTSGSADLEPYASALCTINESSFTLSGGALAVNTAVSAGTEIVAGNVQVLQSFVNNTIMPVATRIQNIVVNLLKPGLVSEGSRFDMSPMAGGFKLSGQTGRAAGGDFRNLAGWGSVSYTELENDNPLTAYDGDRMAFQFGLDYMPKDNMVAGISLGYEDMDVTTTFNQGSMDGQGFTIAPYVGAVLDDNWSVDGLVGLSTVDYDQNRSAGTITGSTDATRIFAAANLNHTYAKQNQWLIMTRAGMMFAKETTDGFTESDGTVNPERESRLVQAQFGADFTYLAGDKFEPYLNATYNYDLSSSSTNIVGAGGALVNPFDDKDDLLLGAGFNYYVNENSTASMDLKHRVFREDFEETIFSASYRANF